MCGRGKTKGIQVNGYQLRGFHQILASISGGTDNCYGSGVGHHVRLHDRFLYNEARTNPNTYTYGFVTTLLRLTFFFLVEFNESAPLACESKDLFMFTYTPKAFGLR